MRDAITGKLCQSMGCCHITVLAMNVLTASIRVSKCYSKSQGDSKASQCQQCLGTLQHPSRAAKPLTHAVKMYLNAPAIPLNAAGPLMK